MYISQLPHQKDTTNTKGKRRSMLLSTVGSGLAKDANKLRNSPLLVGW
jgi:hypothetical protein